MDASAVLAVGTTDPAMRVLASLGKPDAAPTEFPRPCEDVSYGGVLLALPALLAGGLLRHASRFFSLPPGYYGLEHIFALLGLLALCRVKSVEALRYTAPGEWGKLLGLDRCPEAKTLRAKVKHLSTQGDGEAWAAQLCSDWMKAEPAATGTLYIDGHARVYHGGQTKLPRHYIARQRLCLRATTDYWGNGLDGLPFFKINCAVDPGLIRALEEQIVPELETKIPGQPARAELDADPLRMRFRLIFDREGYSPGLFKRMKEKHIACQTYHKHPGKDWDKSEFTPQQVRLMEGGEAEMLLARMTQTEEARQYVAEALAQSPKDGYVGFHSALVYAYIGETDQALRELTRARDRGYYIASELCNNTDLDVLRGLAAFQDLVR